MLLLPLLLLLLLPAVSAAPANPQAPLVRPAAYKTIHSFGNSYTDSAFSPSSPSLPSPSCPLGNPTCLSGSTYMGGHNWLTALTVLSNRSLTVTWNYAHSGDVISSELIPWRGSIERDQFPSFLGAMGQQGGAIGRDDLVSVNIGINDVGNMFDHGEYGMNSSFINEDYTRLFNILDRAYELGARHFLLSNVPPTDRTPNYYYLDDQRMAKLRQALKDVNAMVQQKIDEFGKRRLGVGVYLWDAWAFYSRLLDQPEKWGFTAGPLGVCKTGECIWGDGYHPSDAAHKIFAEEVAVVLEKGGWW